jgi:hypothetical protein
VNRRRLLFLLSSDHGELSNALNFIRGGPFDPMLLLPPGLYEHNRETLPAPASAYSEPAGVVAAIDRFAPELVLLFSGYLYAINRILDPDDLARLVSDLRRRRIPFLTSDPLLGLPSRVDDATFSEAHPHKPWLTAHFARLARIFEGATHLYPTPPDASMPAGSVSFFNPIAGRADPGIAGGRPCWIFILSNEDYSYQIQLLGEAAFLAMLGRMFAATVEAGRVPVLVAPSACAAAVGALPRPVEGLVALSHMGHDRFTAMLRGAEYAFYWNIFSNSVLERAMARRPVFFCGRGHMVHAIRPLYELGMLVYYRGARLPELDLPCDFTPDRLAALAADQDRQFAPARENARAAPTPAELVESLLAAAGRDPTPQPPRP